MVTFAWSKSPAPARASDAVFGKAERTTEAVIGRGWSVGSSFPSSSSGVGAVDAMSCEAEIFRRSISSVNDGLGRSVIHLIRGAIVLAFLVFVFPIVVLKWCSSPKV